MPVPSVTAVVDDENWLVELTVRGPWGRSLWLSAYQALHKCLAQHPAGVLLDLHDLDDPGASSAPLWLTAAAQGTRMDPTVRVAASLPAATRLATRLDVPPARDVLPVFATVPLARAFLSDRRPLTSRIRLRLPPDPAAAAGARQVVSEVCTGWGMPRLAPRARIVVSELVVNAAEHAGTPIDLLVSRRGPDLLHLVVVDGDPALPPMPGGDEPPLETLLTERGYGLRIVDAAAEAWGAMPTRTGKMVWALLRDSQEPRRSSPAGT
ncbi:ATP-binding protein [Actinoplanes flavus]|uniref:ATP-binding protein n=1 Tax=Actinoplanes flavus TaxID=2820290 RepID=UPI0027DE2208|nr:ATP-binding protein [Actinoplanes flavus]